MFELMTKQRMIENPLAERGTLLGIGKRIGHGALCQGDTHYAVRYAREVQHFEDQINSRLTGAQQVAFAVLQLYSPVGTERVAILSFSRRMK